MLRSALPRRHRRLLRQVILSLAVLLAVVAVLLTQGTDTGTPTPPSPPPTATEPQPSRPPAPVVPDHSALAPVAGSANPHEFVDDVARAIFAWDTTTGHDLADYKGRLLVLADPTGHESPGLAADLTAYLPTTAAWTHLSRYRTRQWLEVTEVDVPDQWAQALAQAPADSVPPGTTALTVTGVRHRAGVWEGDEVAAESAVTFTVFVVCQPTYRACHLLRLSQLDNPLR